jgi:hypothetical protein
MIKIIFPKNLVFLMTFMFIFLSTNGCKKESIIVYTIPKETVKSVPASESEHKPLHWEKPNHWVQNPQSRMRLASFSINGKHIKNAEASITVLPGTAGGLTANINRWRGQLELPALNELELKKNYSTIVIKEKETTLVELVSENLLIQNQFKKRMTVAIIREKNQIYFFKLIGENDLVLKERSIFLSFLESVSFE